MRVEGWAMLPHEPPPSRYQMPDPRTALTNGLLASGGDLEPGTVLGAYRAGIFPWPDSNERLLWWSPDPRAILPLDGFHESRSLRRTRRLGVFHTTFDRAYRSVVEGCADRPEGTWITRSMIAAYVALHELGWAHSVEVWASGRLVGGAYGVAIGGFFAAESMFHREADASKVALAELVEHLRNLEFRLLDVQLLTSHLASLGAVVVARDQYLRLLRQAIALESRF
jgi:leucyl/phenylalanyl-tRNA---protein transferase